jgi:diaminopimelate epimerase
MAEILPFFKLSATGNDFILFDTREVSTASDDPAFVRRVCTRRTSVGADGILLVAENHEYDFSLRYINADGSETECGNGARAASYFVSLQGRRALRFSFGDNVYTSEIEGRRVRLSMPSPKDLVLDVGLSPAGSFTEGGFVNTGVPHYVLFTDTLSMVEVGTQGKLYRFHECFAPAGTNVNFVQRLEGGGIGVRTFERGVEAETLSCGTGCVASAVIASLRYGLVYPIEVQTAGGTLIVGGQDRDFYLEGEVDLVYEGKLIAD